MYPDEMGFYLIPKPWRGYYTFEGAEGRFVSMFVVPGMVCFDIGANQGFYSILLSRLVGVSGKVFVFEPVASEFQKLRRNIVANRISNAVLERMAVGSCEGSANMFIRTDGRTFRSSMRPLEERKVHGGKRVEEVPVTTLDSYIQRRNIRQIDFIKIDVEGSERDVLSGGSNLLNEFRPVIMIEMADESTQRFGYLAVENKRTLNSHGYQLFEMFPGGFLKPNVTRENYYSENLVAVPEEKLDRIQRFVQT